MYLNLSEKKIYIVLCLRKFMVRPIPKWVMIRYSALYRELKTKQFTREEARKALDKYSLNEDEKLTNVFFSELAKLGWVEFEQDKNDKRKKIYKLINPEKAIIEMELKD